MNLRILLGTFVAAAGIAWMSASAYADPWKDESGHGRHGWSYEHKWDGEPPDWARGKGFWDGHHKHKHKYKDKHQYKHRGPPPWAGRGRDRDYRDDYDEIYDDYRDYYDDIYDDDHGHYRYHYRSYYPPSPYYVPAPYYYRYGSWYYHW